MTALPRQSRAETPIAPEDIIRLDGTVAFSVTPEGRRALVMAEVALKLERARMTLRERCEELLKIDLGDVARCPVCETTLHTITHEDRTSQPRQRIRARLNGEIDALYVDVRYYEQRIEQLRAGDDAGQPSVLVPGYTVAQVRRMTRRRRPAIDPERAAEVTARKRAYWSETGTTGGTTDHSLSRRAIPRYSALSQG